MGWGEVELWMGKSRGGVGGCGPKMREVVGGPVKGMGLTFRDLICLLQCIQAMPHQAVISGGDYDVPVCIHMYD